MELTEGMPQVEMPEGPVQITGQAGDVVLAHHQLVHTAAPNASPHIRYAAIFRMRHVECEQIGRDAYTDIWREWPGVREALAAE
jgi:ectoine hydroxylase-related dioxygenase (phytanoyl-CoA dioxygenase family)